MINKEQFQQYTDQGFNIIPIAKDVHLDNVTPLTIYSQISDKSNTFLLESVEGGSLRGRYSLLGCDPDIVWEVKNNSASITYLDNNYFEVK